MRERILCAAIWYKDLPKAASTPSNIDFGIVVCGRRHHDVISTVKALSNLRTVTFSEDAVGEFEQGFMTSLNRFVSRSEAALIAKEAGQLREGVVSVQKLFSEDLY